jgi:error-prone DNA polymerase
MQLKGIKQAALEAIIVERAENGDFTNFENFLKRMGNLDLSDVRILIKAGCFDGIAGERARPQLMWQLYQTQARERDRSKPSAVLQLQEREGYYLPDTGHYSQKTMLEHEMDVLGFLVSRHPLTLYEPILRSLPHVKGKDLHKYVGQEVNLVGWLITGKVVHTKNDEPMEFISFEDTSAIYETVFFPETYRKFCRMLSNVRPYFIRGLVEEDFGAISLTVKSIEFLDRVKVQRKRQLSAKSVSDSKGSIAQIL